MPGKDRKPISDSYLARDTDQVARDLVGTYLVRRFNNGEVKRRQITETEAYLGEDDDACHASGGKTKRTKVMYREPGVMYVYLIYGMYDMLNIVTAEEGDPEAVLIRGVEGLNGPGKLTKGLQITKDTHNQRKLGEHAGVWIEKRSTQFDSDTITAHLRVGIDYANKEWRKKKLRFSISE